MAFIPQRFGYRPTILCTNLIFIGGTLLTLFPTLETLLVGRVLVGIAVGINNTTAPVLLSEIAPDAVRGLFTTMHQLGITIGILASGLAGFGFVSYVPMGWRYLFMLGFICPAVQLLFGWYFLPESPRWLLRQAQHEKARAVLTVLRPAAWGVEKELDIMAASAEAEAAAQAGVTWASLLEPQNRKALTIGVGMLLYSCFSGINTVILYSTTIFGFAGVKSALLSTVLVFGLNVLMTIFVTAAVDRAGRKVFLLSGSAAMIVALVSLGVVLLAMPTSTVQGWLAVLAVLVYVAGFAVSFGGVGFTLLSEVVPTAIRPKAFAVALTSNFVSNLALTLSVLSLIEALGWGAPEHHRKRGVAVLYLVFAGIVASAFAFVWLYVPETKGRSLEEIARLMGTSPEALQAPTLLPQGSGPETAMDHTSSSPAGISLPGGRSGSAEQQPLIRRAAAAV